jgi:hypothetical protein
VGFSLKRGLSAQRIRAIGNAGETVRDEYMPTADTIRPNPDRQALGRGREKLLSVQKPIAGDP